jgi:hypothetical protein
MRCLSTPGTERPAGSKQDIEYVFWLRRKDLDIPRFWPAAVWDPATLDLLMHSPDLRVDGMDGIYDLLIRHQIDHRQSLVPRPPVRGRRQGRITLARPSLDRSQAGGPGTSVPN